MRENRVVWLVLWVGAVGMLAACNPGETSPVGTETATATAEGTPSNMPDSASPPPDRTIRLAERVDEATVTGTELAQSRVPDPMSWNFADSSAPGTALDDSPTLGWQALEGVDGFAVADGKLTGTIVSDMPLLNVSIPAEVAVDDDLHSVEVRMRSTGSGSVEFSAMNTAQPIVPMARDGLWAMSTPLIAGEEFRTYTIRNAFEFAAPGFGGTNVRQVFMRFLQSKDAKFEIESVRLVFKQEYLAGRTSGRGWEGLSDIFRDTVVARSPESFSWDVTLPAGAWLDLGVGTIDADPVTFTVSVNPGAESQVVWEQTVDTPERWQAAAINLSAHEGKRVNVTLALSSENPGSLGLWGAPAIRSKRDAGEDAPRGVILIIADTLRRDHLDMYGYDRETAPTLARMAEEGVLFMDCVSPATWTKVATPSIMTGLWPSAHTVKEFTDRLPSSAITLAELYKDAGYATLAMSSVPFTGRFSNMHQGFEELHESSSVKDEKPSKNAREYVDRLLPWLEAHRDAPFFVVLHVFDPHDPFEPHPPYNTMWADPAKRDEHEAQDREVRKVITDPLLRVFGMPNEAELKEAGVDPDAFVSYWKDWYDGAIRGFDTEVDRLMQGLEAMGLKDDTLIALISDHGEEFLEHGETFHGQSVYGELTDVPLMLWQPRVLPTGVKVEQTVQSIDLMPTLLTLSGLDVPEGIHGRSLLPLIEGNSAGWGARPTVIEKAVIVNTAGPANREAEIFGLIAGDWKLVHNTTRPNGEPEFELYDHRNDPLDAVNKAAEHPEIVQALAQRLNEWHGSVVKARLQPDADLAESTSADELEQLKSLGYLE